LASVRAIIDLLMMRSVLFEDLVGGCRRSPIPARETSRFCTFPGSARTGKGVMPTRAGPHDAAARPPRTACSRSSQIL